MHYLAVFGIFTACWLIWLFWRDALRMRKIPRLKPPVERDKLPFVSVLIPARNEERAIRRAVVGVLDQRYAQFELRVLNDHSSDATGAILSELQGHSRLRVLNGQDLPSGWVGKCFACQQLADGAQGEWLLFLDADTVAQPDLLAALVSHAERQQLDLLTVMPFFELGSFWERVVLPAFVAMISGLFPFERMERDTTRPEEVVANGQCLLIRRSAYLAIGGHGAVANEVLEDVRIAQVLRAAGYRIGAAEARHVFGVRMYTNGRELAEGLMKNAAAGYRNSGGRASWAVLRLMLQAYGPLYLLGAGIVWLLVGGGVLAWLLTLAGGLAYLAGQIFWGRLYQDYYQQPWFYALLWPFGLLCYLLIAAWGMWQVWSGRGVRWKGRLYTGE